VKRLISNNYRKHLKKSIVNSVYIIKIRILHTPQPTIYNVG